MKILYIDTFSGISGDMMLGSFINAGMDLELLKNELAKVPIDNYEITAHEIKRNSISATKVDVRILKHEHAHRNISDINTIIDSSALNDKIKFDAKRIFNKIAAAESKVHNLPVEKVHFHEVGAIDSIVDIIGAAICINHLDVEKIYSSPVRVGSNAFVKAQHGKIPIPAPATAELLAGYPVSITDMPYELTTPTGAAIVTSLSSGIMKPDDFIIEKIGYGAGGIEIPELPNLLRIFIGSKYSCFEKDEISVIETNIDDMNPQIYPYVIDKVLELGANDAYLTPVIMKKGRPGMLFTITAQKSTVQPILEFVYANTTTIGVRMYEARREKLKRILIEADTSLGKVKCKITEFNNCKNVFPEFEECKRIAKEKNISLIDVQRLLFKELNP